MNPVYKSTYVFPNDFPAMLEDTPTPTPSDDPLFQIGDAKGICRVMCFHPKMNKTLPVMSPNDIEHVIDEYVPHLCLQSNNLSLLRRRHDNHNIYFSGG